MSDKPIVEIIERGEERIWRDMTGAVVDIAAAEEACRKRECVITIARPSATEGEFRRDLERQYRDAGLPQSIGIRNDPAEPVDLFLRRNGTALAHREVPLGESIKALREILAAHDLLGEKP